MVGIFDVKSLGWLRKQRPLLAAALITAGLWITLALMWPDYRLDLDETTALLLLVTLLSYAGAWTVRSVRRRLGGRAKQ